jgi:hypothetical protein
LPRISTFVESKILNYRLSYRVSYQYYQLQAFSFRRIWSTWYLIIRETASPFVKTILPPLLVLAIGIAVLFVPFPYWITAFATPQNARSFIGQMWQVSGATVGFSIAVTVFAFQGLASGRLSEGAQHHAIRTPLLIVVYLGVTSLITDALVLLNIGYQAPDRWAATWATDVSAISVVSIAFLLTIALRTMDSRVVYRRRISAIGRQASLAVYRDARTRLAISFLTSDAENNGYIFSPLGTSSDTRGRLLRAGKESVVRDIKLKRLHSIAQRCREDKSGRPILTAYPGRNLLPNTVIMVIPGSAASLATAGQKAIVTRNIRASVAPDLNAMADQLHEEAIDAIKTSNLREYSYVVEAQRKLLLSLAKSWQLLGHPLDTAIAEGVFPISQGPASRISRHMYQEIERAVDKDESEIVLEAGYLPITVATEALDLNADGLSGEMMDLLISSASMSSDNRTATLLRHHILLNIHSYLDFTVAPELTNEASDEQVREKAAIFLKQGMSAITNMAQNAIGVGRAEFFEAAQSNWNQVLQQLNFDESALHQDQSPSRRLEAEVSSDCKSMQFCLTAWVLHKLWISAGDEALKRMLGTSLKLCGSASDGIAAVQSIVSSKKSSSISQWLLREMPVGAVYSLESTVPLHRLVALMLLRDACSSRSRITESPWIADAHDALVREVDALTARPELWDLASSNCAIDAVADIVRNELLAAVQRQHDKNEQDLISAAVGDKAKAAFLAGVEEGWNNDRKVVAALLSTGGTAHIDEGSRPVPKLGSDPSLESKEFAVQPDCEPAMNHIGQQLGRGLAVAESRLIYKRLADSPRIEAACGSILNGCVGEAKARMMADGYIPKLLVIGGSWSVWNRFDGSAVPEGCKLDKRLSGVLGLVEGLLAIHGSALEADCMVLVDSAKWGGAYEWTMAGGTAIEASINDYTEAAATELIAKNPNLFADMENPTIQRRVTELRKRIRVDAYAHIDIRVNDALAARRIDITP